MSHLFLTRCKTLKRAFLSNHAWAFEKRKVYDDEYCVLSLQLSYSPITQFFSFWRVRLFGAMSSSVLCLCCLSGMMVMRINHNGINIFTGNGDVTHQECTSSPGMHKFIQGDS